MTKEVIAIKIRPSVVLVDGDKVLLMRYLYGETEVWGVPGGGPDEDESLTDALVRELDEELGVEIEVGELLAVLETPAAGKVARTLHCVFAGKVTGGEPAVHPEHTSALDVAWVGADEVAGKVLYPPVNDVVREALKDEVRPRYLGVRERRWF